MTPQQSLSLLRGEIDAVDRELVALFERRMALAARIGETKAAVGTAVLDEAREQQVIERALEFSAPANHAAAAEFMRKLMELSRARQARYARPPKSGGDEGF